MPDVKVVLAAASSAATTVEPGARISAQQALLHAAVVLLAARLEAFFRALPADFIGSLEPDNPLASSIGVRAAILRSSAASVSIARKKAGLCLKEKQQRELLQALVLAARWAKTPRRFLESSRRPRLRGFYRKSGSQAVDDLLSSLRPDRKRFFSWIGSLGADRSSYWTTLEGIVNARNVVAHGSASPSLTLADVRGYVAKATKLCRFACRYLS